MVESSITSRTSTKTTNMVVALDAGTGATPTDQSQLSESQSVQDDSDDDCSIDMGIFDLGKCTKSDEPIRPGDEIEYYNPIFIYGR